MKKDLYLIAGIIAVVVAGTLTAFMYYRRSQPPVTAPVAGEVVDGRVDMGLLIGDDRPSQGPTTARVVLVEFLDPECESCRALHPVTKTILKEYEGKVRYVVRFMPFHANSVYAASMLEAARIQGKFWEALDLLFEHQPEWGSHSAPKPELIPASLKPLKLDMAKLVEDAKNPEVAALVYRDKQDGIKAGVNGTPTFFVNGRMLRELGDAPLRAMIDEELK